MAAVAFVDVGEQLAALLLGDASQRDSIRAVAVQVTLPQVVERGLADHMLCFRVDLRESAALQVGLDLCGLVFRLRLEHKQQASA